MEDGRQWKIILALEAQDPIGGMDRLVRWYENKNVNLPYNISRVFAMTKIECILRKL